MVAIQQTRQWPWHILIKIWVTGVRSPLRCDYWQVIRLSSHFTDTTNHTPCAILYKLCKKKKIWGGKKKIIRTVRAHVALCMPTLRAIVRTWTYWWLTATVIRWAWHYGPYCCSIIHFSPYWWILMALHKIGGVKGMLCHGTSIDPIDIRCQQRLAYFSWVYLESTVWLDCIISSVTSIVFHFSCFPFWVLLYSPALGWTNHLT